MNLDSIRDQFGSFWNNVTEGWRHLWVSAANALTRFVPGSSSNLPQANEPVFQGSRNTSDKS